MFRLNLHIIQNSWQPLHGLSHSVIILQKVLSHISTASRGSCAPAKCMPLNIYTSVTYPTHSSYPLLTEPSVIIIILHSLKPRPRRVAMGSRQEDEYEYSYPLKGWDGCATHSVLLNRYLDRHQEFSLSVDQHDLLRQKSLTHADVNADHYNQPEETYPSRMWTLTTTTQST